MRPASKKEIESFKQWKKNPTPKSKFIFLYGSFMWGIPTGVLAYFISISLNKEPFDIAQFGIRILVFMLAGLLFWLLYVQGQGKTL